MAATAVEATVIFATLVLGVRAFGLVGALAATGAIVIGRFAGNLFLLLPIRPPAISVQDSEE